MGVVMRACLLVAVPWWHCACMMVGLCLPTNCRFLRSVSAQIFFLSLGAMVQQSSKGVSPCTILTPLLYPEEETSHSKSKYAI